MTPAYSLAASLLRTGREAPYSLSASFLRAGREAWIQAKVVTGVPWLKLIIILLFIPFFMEGLYQDFLFLNYNFKNVKNTNVYR